MGSVPKIDNLSIDTDVAWMNAERKLAKEHGIISSDELHLVYLMGVSDTSGHYTKIIVQMSDIIENAFKKLKSYSDAG